MPLIILLGLQLGQATLDFQLYDTYYVMTIHQYVVAAVVLLWSFGMIYWAFDKAGKKPNYVFSLLHLTTTIVIFTIVAVPSFGLISPFTLLVVFAVAQLAFIANVFISLLRK